MKRVDADGHDNNLYSNGDPQQAIAPTLLRAEEMNAIQEEICNVIEGFGVALNPADDEQLSKAIGRNYSTTILNNQVSAVDLTSFVFDGTKEVGAIIDYKMERLTDSFKTYAIGTLKVLFRSDLNNWIIFRDENYDDAYSSTGIVFTILSSGQIQYTSSNVAGSGYVGTFKGRITKIFI